MLTLVVKDSLRTNFKSLSLWNVGLVLESLVLVLLPVGPVLVNVTDRHYTGEVENVYVRPTLRQICPGKYVPNLIRIGRVL